MLYPVNALDLSTSIRVDLDPAPLAALIRQNGLQKEIELVEHVTLSGSAFTIREGFRRVAAYRLLGWSLIPARIVERTFAPECFDEG